MKRWIILLLVVVALPVIPIVGVSLLGAAGQSAAAAEPGGVNLDAIPDPAARAMVQELLPLIEARRNATCPELPTVWIVAQAYQESRWQPRAWATDVNGGTAGFFQMNYDNWADAGGDTAGWNRGTRPIDAAVVWDARTQINLGIPWICANLRDVTRHLNETGKKTDPLVAMLVAHNAGPGRVYGSPSGVPGPGQGRPPCSAECSRNVADYISRIQGFVKQFSAIPPSGDASSAATPCAPGTKDDGVKVTGKGNSIRICIISGIDVNAAISGQVSALLAAAKADGVTLGGGGFRSLEEQIRLRRTNGCPDVWNSPSSACRVQTARPGSSQHEQGLAIDFTYQGSTICFPRRSASCNGNVGFEWLSRNAARFGLVNLPAEAWHWSTTGK